MAFVTALEIADYMGLAETPNFSSPANSVDRALLMERNAASQELKVFCRRNFEEQVGFIDRHTIQPGQESVQLSEYPVSAVTALTEISSWDSSGDIATSNVLSGDQYRLDLSSGLLISLKGALTVGVDAFEFTGTVGYSATDISNSVGEMSLVKTWVLSRLSQNYRLAEGSKRHLSSVSFGEESVSYQTGMDSGMLEIIQSLRREPTWVV